MSTTTLPSPPAIDALTEKPRISSIDIVRGIVMVIMALDHVRDFFHKGAMVTDPTNMTTTTPAIFFTRWITHYCAPTFVFLAGTSIFISAQRKPKKELSIFLLTRGLWLIFLELVVVRFGILFNFYYDVILFQVIWVIGASMICLSLFIHFSYRIVLAIGLALLFLHNITDAFLLKPEDPFFGTWSILRQSGFLNLTENYSLLVFYPLLPWLGIMTLGFCSGKLYARSFNPMKRQPILLWLGFGALLLFVLLRSFNLYGDPAPWAIQKNGIFTIMSFLNTTKYPVSLLYSLMTLGPLLIILSLLERANWTALKPFTVFGRVPLFYYILHFYLIHATALLLFMNKTGKSFSEIDFHFDKSFGGLTDEAGYSLFWAYVAWIIIVLFLYPVCKWYNQYKSTHANWWLSYL